MAEILLTIKILLVQAVEIAGEIRAGLRKMSGLEAANGETLRKSENV